MNKCCCSIIRKDQSPWPPCLPDRPPALILLASIALALILPALIALASIALALIPLA